MPDGYSIDTNLPLASKENDYLVDRHPQRTKKFSGMLGINDEDRGLQETMQSTGRPGVVDRSQEMLVRSDLSISTTRRILVRLLNELEKGRDPIAVQAADQYGGRALSVVTPISDFDELLQAYGDMLRQPLPTV